MTTPLTTLSEYRCFGGVQAFYSHFSEEVGLPMRFGVFLPPQAQQGPVPTVCLRILGLPALQQAQSRHSLHHESESSWNQKRHCFSKPHGSVRRLLTKIAVPTQRSDRRKIIRRMRESFDLSFGGVRELGNPLYREAFGLHEIQHRVQ